MRTLYWQLFPGQRTFTLVVFQFKVHESSENTRVLTEYPHSLMLWKKSNKVLYLGEKIQTKTKKEKKNHCHIATSSVLHG